MPQFNDSGGMGSTASSIAGSTAGNIISGGAFDAGNRRAGSAAGGSAAGGNSATGSRADGYHGKSSFKGCGSIAENSAVGSYRGAASMRGGGSVAEGSAADGYRGNGGIRGQGSMVDSPPRSPPRGQGSMAGSQYEQSNIGSPRSQMAGSRAGGRLAGGSQVAGSYVTGSRVSGSRAGGSRVGGSRAAASEVGTAVAAEIELSRLEDVILSKLQQRVPARMSEENFLVKAFKYFDFSNNGVVDFETFRRACGPYTSGIGEQEMRAVFTRYAPDGELFYKQFAAEFISGYRREQAVGLASEAGQSQAWCSPEEVLGRMQDVLRRQGPRAIIALASSFRESDPENTRLARKPIFEEVILLHFSADSGCPVHEEQAAAVFSLFEQPHSPGEISYDEFLQVLKDDSMNQERREVIRTAFRHMDTNSEGLVDIGTMLSTYNANRHPQVSDGSREPEDILAEFEETLKEAVGFRRGQQAYPTTLVAWEEFEDYYKFVSGCFDSDQAFCTVLRRVWDLDKAPDKSIEGRDGLARSAAGIRAKARAGLHHWQSNTLPQNRTHCPGDDYVKADDVLLHVRQKIADKGIRAAVEVVQNFFAADDDMDELLDTYEFRRACKESGIVLVASEEAAVLDACGIESAAHGCVHLQKFLRMLHGPLSRQRYELIEQAFRGVGGDPESEDSGINPATLKQQFTPEGHPLVVKRQMDPGILLAEFLDTFSLLAHCRGGCQNGMVSFADFLAYYDLVSSTIENDSYFDLLMHRMWPVGGEEDRADKWAVPVYDPSANPTARNRPPAHHGPTAYSNQIDETSHVPATHRRFSRNTQGDGAQSSDQRPAPYSAITKSSIVFNEAETGELGTVLRRLRDGLSRRGIKGWLMLSERAEQLDTRRNGGILRLDWQRLQRSLGLGLAPEEQEALFKGFVNGRRDGAMDWPLCLQSLRAGLLSDRRQGMVDRLFEDLADDGARLQTQVLQQAFDAKSVPSCFVGRRDPTTERRDFCDAVEHFSKGADFDSQAFSDFFSMMSSCYKEEDEFRLMTSTAFGLSPSPAVGGC